MTQCNYLFILEAERGSLRVDARQSCIWVLRWQLHNALKGNRFILALAALFFCGASKLARDGSSHLNIWFLFFCRCDVVVVALARGGPLNSRRARVIFERERAAVYSEVISKTQNKPVMVQETAYVNVFSLGWIRLLLSCWLPSLRRPRS